MGHVACLIYSSSKVLVWYLNYCSALGTWVFSVAGALLAIPVGIKRKSLAPLVFFGTTGTMLDIIMGISACEREHAERQMKLMEEAQRSSSVDTFTDATTEHWWQSGRFRFWLQLIAEVHVAFWVLLAFSFWFPWLVIWILSLAEKKANNAWGDCTCECGFFLKSFLLVTM